eukprot:131008_1
MSQYMTNYAVEFEIDVEGGSFSNIQMPVVYLQRPTMSELRKEAHQQLMQNRIVNYSIVKFTDNDNCQYDDDDDLEEVWPDSDDEENDGQVLQLKIVLEPNKTQSLKLTPAADSDIKIQQPSVYENKYKVKLHVDIDNNIDYVYRTQTSSVLYFKK